MDGLGPAYWTLLDESEEQQRCLSSLIDHTTSYDLKCVGAARRSSEAEGGSSSNNGDEEDFLGIDTAAEAFSSSSSHNISREGDEPGEPSSVCEGDGSRSYVGGTSSSSNISSGEGDSPVGRDDERDGGSRTQMRSSSSEETGGGGGELQGDCWFAARATDFAEQHAAPHAVLAAGASGCCDSSSGNARKGSRKNASAVRLRRREGEAEEEEEGDEDDFDEEHQQAFVLSTAAPERDFFAASAGPASCATAAVPSTPHCFAVNSRSEVPQTAGSGHLEPTCYAVSPSGPPAAAAPATHAPTAAELCAAASARVSTCGSSPPPPGAAPPAAAAEGGTHADAGSPKQEPAVTATLEVVLNNEHFLEELHTGEDALIRFLSSPVILLELVKLVTTVPPSDASEARKSSSPFFAAEVFCCVSTSILSVFLTDPKGAPARDAFWQFLYNTPPLNPVLAGYFTRCWQAILKAYPEEATFAGMSSLHTGRADNQDNSFYVKTIAYMAARGDVAESLCRHLYSRSIADFYKCLLYMDPCIPSIIDPKKVIPMLFSILRHQRHASQLTATTAAASADAAAAATEEARQAAAGSGSAARTASTDAASPKEDERARLAQREELEIADAAAAASYARDAQQLQQSMHPNEQGDEGEEGRVKSADSSVATSSATTGQRNLGRSAERPPSSGAGGNQVGNGNSSSAVDGSVDARLKRGLSNSQNQTWDSPPAAAADVSAAGAAEVVCENTSRPATASNFAAEVDSRSTATGPVVTRVAGSEAASTRKSETAPAVGSAAAAAAAKEATARRETKAGNSATVAETGAPAAVLSARREERGLEPAQRETPAAPAAATAERLAPAADVGRGAEARAATTGEKAGRREDKTAVRGAEQQGEREKQEGLDGEIGRREEGQSGAGARWENAKRDQLGVCDMEAQVCVTLVLRELVYQRLFVSYFPTLLRALTAEAAVLQLLDMLTSKCPSCVSSAISILTDLLCCTCVGEHPILGCGGPSQAYSLSEPPTLGAATAFAGAESRDAEEKETAGAAAAAAARRGSITRQGYISPLLCAAAEGSASFNCSPAGQVTRLQGDPAVPEGIEQDGTPAAATTTATDAASPEAAAAGGRRTLPEITTEAPLSTVAEGSLAAAAAAAVNAMRDPTATAAPFSGATAAGDAGAAGEAAPQTQEGSFPAGGGGLATSKAGEALSSTAGETDAHTDNDPEQGDTAGSVKRPDERFLFFGAALAVDEGRGCEEEQQREEETDGGTEAFGRQPDMQKEQSQQQQQAEDQMAPPINLAAATVVAAADGRSVDAAESATAAARSTTDKNTSEQQLQQELQQVQHETQQHQQKTPQRPQGTQQEPQGTEHWQQPTQQLQETGQQQESREEQQKQHGQTVLQTEKKHIESQHFLRYVEHNMRLQDEGDSTFSHREELPTEVFTSGATENGDIAADAATAPSAAISHSGRQTDALRETPAGAPQAAAAASQAAAAAMTSQAAAAATSHAAAATTSQAAAAAASQVAAAAASQAAAAVASQAAGAATSQEAAAAHPAGAAPSAETAMGIFSAGRAADSGPRREGRQATWAEEAAQQASECFSRSSEHSSITTYRGDSIETYASIQESSLHQATVLPSSSRTEEQDKVPGAASGDPHKEEATGGRRGEDGGGQAAEKQETTATGDANGGDREEEKDATAAAATTGERAADHATGGGEVSNSTASCGPAGEVAAGEESIVGGQPGAAGVVVATDGAAAAAAATEGQEHEKQVGGGIVPMFPASTRNDEGPIRIVQERRASGAGLDILADEEEYEDGIDEEGDISERLMRHALLQHQQRQERERQQQGRQRHEGQQRQQLTPELQEERAGQLHQQPNNEGVLLGTVEDREEDPLQNMALEGTVFEKEDKRWLAQLEAGEYVDTFVAPHVYRLILKLADCCGLEPVTPIVPRSSMSAAHPLNARAPAASEDRAAAAANPTESQGPAEGNSSGRGEVLVGTALGTSGDGAVAASEQRRDDVVGSSSVTAGGRGEAVNFDAADAFTASAAAAGGAAAAVTAAAVPAAEMILTEEGRRRSRSEQQPQHTQQQQELSPSQQQPQHPYHQVLSGEAATRSAADEWLYGNIYEHARGQAYTAEHPVLSPNSRASLASVNSMTCPGSGVSVYTAAFAAEAETRLTEAQHAGYCSSSTPSTCVQGAASLGGSAANVNPTAADSALFTTRWRPAASRRHLLIKWSGYLDRCCASVSPGNFTLDSQTNGGALLPLVPSPGAAAAAATNAGGDAAAGTSGEIPVIDAETEGAVHLSNGVFASVGIQALEFLTLVKTLLKSNAVHTGHQMLELGLLDLCVEALFHHPWNNLLHLTVTDVLQTVLQRPPELPEGLEVLLTRSRLVPLMLSHFRNRRALREQRSAAAAAAADAAAERERQRAEKRAAAGRRLQKKRTAHAKLQPADEQQQGEAAQQQQQQPEAVPATRDGQVAGQRVGSPLRPKKKKKKLKKKKRHHHHDRGDGDTEEEELRQRRLRKEPCGYTPHLLQIAQMVSAGFEGQPDVRERLPLQWQRQWTEIVMEELLLYQQVLSSSLSESNDETEEAYCPTLPMQMISPRAEDVRAAAHDSRAGSHSPLYPQHFENVDVALLQQMQQQQIQQPEQQSQQHLAPTSGEEDDDDDFDDLPHLQHLHLQHQQHQYAGEHLTQEVGSLEPEQQPTSDQRHLLLEPQQQTAFVQHQYMLLEQQQQPILDQEQHQVFSYEPHQLSHEQQQPMSHHQHEPCDYQHQQPLDHQQQMQQHYVDAQQGQGTAPAERAGQQQPSQEHVLEQDGQLVSQHPHVQQPHGHEQRQAAPVCEHHDILTQQQEPAAVAPGHQRVVLEVETCERCGLQNFENAGTSHSAAPAHNAAIYGDGVELEDILVAGTRDDACSAAAPEEKGVDNAASGVDAGLSGVPGATTFPTAAALAAEHAKEYDAPKTADTAIRDDAAAALTDAATTGVSELPAPAVSETLAALAALNTPEGAGANLAETPGEVAVEAHGEPDSAAN